MLFVQRLGHFRQILGNFLKTILWLNRHRKRTWFSWETWGVGGVYMIGTPFLTHFHNGVRRLPSTVGSSHIWPQGPSTVPLPSSLVRGPDYPFPLRSLTSGPLSILRIFQLSIPFSSFIPFYSTSPLSSPWFRPSTLQTRITDRSAPS